MHVTFLEAASGTRLSKQYCAEKGFTPYPNVSKVSSHIFDITKDEDGLGVLEQLILEKGAVGWCLLKGDLKRPVVNESRRGAGDRIAYTSLLVLDIDGITLGAHGTQKYCQDDVRALAESVLGELPAALKDTSYIAQASSSMGLKGDKVSLHIFMLMKHPMPPKTVKLWMQNTNFESPLFLEQLELSANGHSLRYPIDISVADNSKLIFIAPPTFEDNACDPFRSYKERVVRVTKHNSLLDLAALMSDVSPEKVHTHATERKNILRVKKGFSAKKERITISNVGDRNEEILQNPDRMSINISNEDYSPYIMCNVNGGDSGAYWFNLKDPTYMYNFKGEPIWSIETADPDFYKGIFDHYEKELSIQGRANHPIALRDFSTDTYYNGVFDPNLNQFTSTFPLVPCAASSIEGFMRSHGRTKPEFIPDASVVFDPCSTAPAVNLTKIPYTINMFRQTNYMLSAKKHTELEMGEATQLMDACPLVYKLIMHILGGGKLEFEYFINWLAYIFQTKQKAGTAWVLQGVPGTGKGIFYTKVLRPLFGQEHVPMRALQNIEEQFNSYMRQALFLVVDEFHMASANAGTIKIADKLKNAITETTMTIRGMRSNQVEMPSYVNFIFLTNRPDAVNIEEGDRRYNIAPRQEVALKDAHPEVIDNIDSIQSELMTFAAVLRHFKVEERFAHTPMTNIAKIAMAEVTMSVVEEFFAAVKKGQLKHFLEILDIQLNNVLAGQDINTAQRMVKTWVVDAENEHYSIIPMEHLRLVYQVLTEERMSPHAFKKVANRSRVIAGQKRPVGAPRTATALRGVVVTWELEEDLRTEVILTYFNDNDKALLATA